MKVIVAGSRGITDYDFVKEVLDKSQFPISEVVCGGARGIDSLGARWASENGIPCVMFIPNWNKFGRAAGVYRNSEMAAYADAAVIVWDGESRGTLDMIDRMRRSGKPKEVYFT